MPELKLSKLKIPELKVSETKIPESKDYQLFFGGLYFALTS